jgi:ribosomal protein S3
MATQAYQITVRRIATGCDFHIRLFAVNIEKAIERATDRARFAEKISLQKAADLSAQGIAIFRVVSAELSADQSRPIA